MTVVIQGDVYITYYPECTRDKTNRPTESIYFIDKIQNKEICNAVVITFWSESLPTLCQTTGPISDIVSPGYEGSSHQGTQKDWNRALYRVFDMVENYTRWIYKLDHQEEKE